VIEASNMTFILLGVFLALAIAEMVMMRRGRYDISKHLDAFSTIVSILLVVAYSFYIPFIAFLWVGIGIINLRTTIQTFRMDEALRSAPDAEEE